MDNSEKLSLFRNGRSKSIGLTDISLRSKSLDLQMQLVNGYNTNSNSYRQVCTVEPDGTHVAPCSCFGVIRPLPTRQVCTVEPDGTHVAPCSCFGVIRPLPTRLVCTVEPDGTRVAPCGCVGVIKPL